MSAKYAINPSATTLTSTTTTPNFFSNRTPFYTNPKERHFLQEVLNINWYILGLSMFVVIFVGSLLGVHSSFSMSRIGSDGAPVSEEGNVCLTLPIMLVGYIFGLITFVGMGKLKGTQCGAIVYSYEIGEKYNRVLLPAWTKASILVVGPLMLVAYLPDINVVTFFNLELPTMLVYMIVGMAIVTKPVNNFLLKEGAIDNSKAEALTRRNSIRRASQAALTIVHEPTTTTQSKSSNGIKFLFALMSNLLIFLAYPFTVLTLFRSFGVGGRMAIVLLFHPLIMEFLMHGYRASTGGTTNLLGERVKVDPMRDLMGVFVLESYLVLIRRIMLCNLGSFQATTIAIIVTGIEETAVRSTIEVSERARRTKLNTLTHLQSNPTQSNPIHPNPPPPFTATRHLVPRVLPQQAPSHPRRVGRAEEGLGGLHLPFHARRNVRHLHLHAHVHPLR